MLPEIKVTLEEKALSIPLWIFTAVLVVFFLLKVC